MAKEKTGVVQSIVTKKDLLYAWFKWFIFSHCCINYEALERHQEFFNTEPYIGIVIMGISVAMEEQRAKDGSVSGEAITAVKTGLMGPLAGIGDTLNQAIIYPILLAFSVALVLENNLGVAGVVIYCVLVVAAMAAQSIYFVNYGYRLGKDAVSKILKGGLMDRIVHAAGIVGCGVLGALTATYVSLSTTLTYGSGEQAISLQADFLDQLMPKMLPLAVTLVCFWLVKKGKGAIKIMGILAVGVVALSLLHII